MELRMASTIAEAADKAIEAFMSQNDDTPSDDGIGGSEDGFVDSPAGNYLAGQDTVQDVDADYAPDGSSDAENPPTPENRIEVTEDDVILLPDGTAVNVRESALRQADYTRKTQQLAEERRRIQESQNELDNVLESFEGWYQDRAANPDRWISEIAKSLPDRGVRTQMVARALKELAETGYLEDDFVEMFGLAAGPAAEFAKEPEEDRVARLEAQLQAQQLDREIEMRVRQQAAMLQGQWDEIKSTYGLSFADPNQEFEAKRETLEFAKQNNVPSLRVAFDALQTRRQTAPSRQPDAATTEKKRASRAITPKSSAAGQVAPPKKKAKTISEAASMALDKYLSGN
jgi:hypothetical protein